MDYNVLVVEDSAARRTFNASTVEEIDGVVASKVGSGFKALKALAKGAFDLIITDINMPDINGFEMIRFIRENEHYAEIPLIIVSTESSRRDRERGLAQGANAYLVKPFKPADLKEIVGRFLKGV